MVRIPVTGKKVPLLIYYLGQWVPVACLVSVKIWLEERLDDTSTPDSGRYKTRWPANDAEWGVEMEGVTVLTDATDQLWYTWQFFLELVRSNGVNIRVPVEDINGNLKIFEGFVFINYAEITGNAAEPWSKSSVKLLSSGGLL